MHTCTACILVYSHKQEPWHCCIAKVCAHPSKNSAPNFSTLVAFSIKTFCARKKNKFNLLPPPFSLSSPALHFQLIGAQLAFYGSAEEGGKGKRSFAMTSQKKSPTLLLPKMAKSSQVVAASNYCCRGNGHPIYFKTERIPPGRATVVEVSPDI